MRILVTNDDGVHAPGIGAITNALAKWAADAPTGEVRDVVVIAPLANHSGSSAAVGTVFERETIGYRSVRIEGAEGIAAYGLDASPALSVIVGALGAFGPRPDLVVSGINLGVNVGRSVLHSGTVGAALTAAQMGIRAMAVSMQSGTDPVPWDTAATTALAVLPSLMASAPRTVFNLNLPSVPIEQLRGIRRGRIGTAGLVKAAGTPSIGRTDDAAMRPRALVTPHVEDSDEGDVVLSLGAAVPSLGDVGDEDPDDDGALIAAGYASLTPIVGAHEDDRAEADELVRSTISDVRSLLPRS